MTADDLSIARSSAVIDRRYSFYGNAKTNNAEPAS